MNKITVNTNSDNSGTIPQRKKVIHNVFGKGSYNFLEDVKIQCSKQTLPKLWLILIIAPKSDIW